MSDLLVALYVIAIALGLGWLIWSAFIHDSARCSTCRKRAEEDEEETA